MSINLYVEATRPAQVIVKGETKTVQDRIRFDLWQTPTSVTRDVLRQDSVEEQVRVYDEWTRTVSEPYQEEVFDFTQFDENFDYKVVGWRTRWLAYEHINELQSWLKMCEAEDYTVEFFEM